MIFFLQKNSPEPESQMSLAKAPCIMNQVLFIVPFMRDSILNNLS